MQLPGEDRPLPFPALRYDRVSRTQSSESYLLSEHDEPMGRVDLHYGSHVVHALLVLERDVPANELRDLVDRIDEDLVWTADVPRDDFLVTVYRGEEIDRFQDDIEDIEEDLEE